MESDDKNLEDLIKEMNFIIRNLSESSSYGLLLFARGLLKSEQNNKN